MSQVQIINQSGASAAAVLCPIANKPEWKHRTSARSRQARTPLRAARLMACLFPLDRPILLIAHWREVLSEQSSERVRRARQSLIAAFSAI